MMLPSQTGALVASIPLVTVLCTVSTAQPTRRPWQLNEFMISVWGGPNSPELARCLAEDARFNTVMAGPGWAGEPGLKGLDLAGNHGLKVLLKIAPEDVTPQISGHPALWGYFVFDEPVQCQVSYDSLLPAVSAFRAVDPRHPVYINLNNADDTAAFIQVIAPDLLSVDRYQWWYGSDDYFPLLERYRATSLQHALPLLWWVEANADEDRSHTPRDNRRKLRQSVYCALAYGVKGIQWFGWGEACSWEPSPDTERWQLKPAGRDVAAINGELQRLGPVLLPLRSVAVYHTPPLPAGTSGIPAGCPVQTDTPSLVLGLMDDETGGEYLLVANRDYTQSSRATLRLGAGVSEASRFSKHRGQWLPLALDHNDGGLVTVNLQPGDGELLRVVRH